MHKSNRLEVAQDRAFTSNINIELPAESEDVDLAEASMNFATAAAFTMQHWQQGLRLFSLPYWIT